MKWGMEPFLVLNRTISSKSESNFLDFFFQSNTQKIYLKYLLLCLQKKGIQVQKDMRKSK